MGALTLCGDTHRLCIHVSEAHTHTHTHTHVTHAHAYAHTHKQTNEHAHTNIGPIRLCQKRAKLLSQVLTLTATTKRQMKDPQKGKGIGGGGGEREETDGLIERLRDYDDPYGPLCPQLAP